MTLSAASALLLFFFPALTFGLVFAFGLTIIVCHRSCIPRLLPSPCALFAAEKAFLPIALHRVRAPAIPSLSPLCIPSPFSLLPFLSAPWSALCECVSARPALSTHWRISCTSPFGILPAAPTCSRGLPSPARM